MSSIAMDLEEGNVSNDSATSPSDSKDLLIKEETKWVSLVHFLFVYVLKSCTQACHQKRTDPSESRRAISNPQAAGEHSATPLDYEGKNGRAAK